MNVDLRSWLQIRLEIWYPGSGIQRPASNDQHPASSIIPGFYNNWNLKKDPEINSG
jgi:hypothetical protein